MNIIQFAEAQQALLTLEHSMESEVAQKVLECDMQLLVRLGLGGRFKLIGKYVGLGGKTILELQPTKTMPQFRVNDAIALEDADGAGRVKCVVYRLKQDTISVVCDDAIPESFEKSVIA